MDANLNRARLMYRRGLLAIFIASCASATTSFSNEMGKPQRISARTERSPASSSSDASLFIREPSTSGATWQDQTPTPTVPRTVSAPRQPLMVPASSRRPIANSANSSRPDASGAFSILVPEPTAVPIEPNVLPGFSSASLRQTAAQHLDTAVARLAHRASYSATAESMQALRLIAQSLDVVNGQNQFSMQLEAAVIAIEEAEDFSGRYGQVDATAIARMVKSHKTVALKGYDVSALTGFVAADIYYDAARKLLAPLAGQDPLAATALGILSRSYRQRANEAPLALAVSVHLMRAASSASPTDAGLAKELASVLDEAKLYHESQTVLARAQSLEAQSTMLATSAKSNDVIAVVSGTKPSPDKNGVTQSVQIEQLSTEAFMATSRAEAGPPASAATAKASASSPATTTVAKENPITRSFKTMTRFWQEKDAQ